ncbi:hypothetical protein HMN09_00364800 [Mycena chlorophos]|uniref:Hyaluronan/mRNA-binding protein domain-containing protein n=1 Tax=Mycena chlorophos TaxID=658473 RepID=A0A8H6TJQ1_MYCCL|nr:hypothetical protein HMN09_00364800 [Mycena chlorophos]
MTRTARSASLRSMLKDRSENKTGVSGALRKNGGGAHNWGSLENERDLEFAGMDDGAAELEEDRASDDNNDTESLTDDASSSGSDEVALKKPTLSPTTTSDDIAVARKFRTNALKAGAELDLAAIARTSVAMAGSPPKA